MYTFFLAELSVSGSLLSSQMQSIKDVLFSIIKFSNADFPDSERIFQRIKNWYFPVFIFVVVWTGFSCDLIVALPYCNQCLATSFKLGNQASWLPPLFKPCVSATVLYTQHNLFNFKTVICANSRLIPWIRIGPFPLTSADC